MNDELIQDTARMFANDIIKENEGLINLEDGRVLYNGDVMTRGEFVEELQEWEHRGACTTDYFSGSGKLWGDEYHIEDEYGNMVMADLSPIVYEYFRILSNEWAVVPADRHAELVRKVEQLKRAFLEVNELVLHCDYSDAVETLFNSGTGCSTYPFAESFDEVTARVAYWEIGGE